VCLENEIANSAGSPESPVREHGSLDSNRSASCGRLVQARLSTLHAIPTTKEDG
jgi:hypothetical protein